jgi:hypothetical protein
VALTGRVTEAFYGQVYVRIHFLDGRRPLIEIFYAYVQMTHMYVYVHIHAKAKDSCSCNMYGYMAINIMHVFVHNKDEKFGGFQLFSALPLRL